MVPPDSQLTARHAEIPAWDDMPTELNRDAARNYGDFFNTHAFTGLFEAMACRELRRDRGVLN